MAETLPDRIDDPRLSIGVVAIDGGAGGDIRSDPDFESLDAAVRRMETDGPNAVPWPMVARDGLKLIETKAKDLLVAVWTTFALARTEGVRGLAVGLGIIEGMAGAHWDGMQPPPKRERARVGAMEWLSGRLVPLVGEWKPGPDQHADVLAAYETLDAVDRLFAEKLTKEQLALGELIRSLRPRAEEARRAIAEANKPKPEPPAAAAAPAAQPAVAQQAAPVAAAPAASAQPAAPAPPAAVGADLNRSVGQLQDSLRSHAAALRQADPADPRGYLLVRAAAWLPVRVAPPAQAGRTALPPPDAGRIAALDGLQKAGQHLEAIAAAESLVASSPFLIDANLWTCRSLAALGPAFADARRAVLGAVAAHLHRVPMLTDLAFSDGRRFVSDALAAMLAEAGVGGGAAAAGGGAADEVADLASEARKLAGEGKPADGATLLADALRRAGGGRRRLQCQIAQAQFLIEFDFHTAAWLLIDHLDQEIERVGLEGWEPDLAARAAELRLRLAVSPQLAKSIPEDRRRPALDTARARLSRLDVGSAIRLLT